MKPTSLLTIALPILAATLSAQTPDHLVGITRATPFLRHVSHAPCAMLAQCPLPMPSAVLLPAFAGGTAWDPTRSGAWVTNGTLLGKFDDNCTVQCPPMPIPTLAANAFITGLEVVEGPNQLWMIDSLGNLHRYSNTCPPAPLGVCNTGLGPTAIGNVTTGLAVDELQGIVFIAHPIFPNGPNRIVVSLLAAPCVPVSQFVLPACFPGFGAVLGLACDWGNRILYATDGVGTIALNYGFVSPAIVLGPITCCPPIAVIGEPMIGLAIRPGRATSVGGPCANGPCPNCPMVHSLRNDPCLGNAQFTLGLDQAQPNAFALLAVGAGPCMVPGIVGFPLCGPLHTIPLLGTLGPNLTGGGFAPCDGSTNFNIPLPVAAGLAGMVFSSQAVTICVSTTGALGFGMSNCLSWQLQGN
ncbi:MAG: hypothetical protein WAT39_11875 [Planctomycetota bacterium]